MGGSRDEDTKNISIEPEILQAALHSIAALKRLELPHECYLLHLTDLQILVGKVVGGGTWSDATAAQHQHLMESFTLSVKIQRYVYVQVNLATTYLVIKLLIFPHLNKVETMHAAIISPKVPLICIN